MVLMHPISSTQRVKSLLRPEFVEVNVAMRILAFLILSLGTLVFASGPQAKEQGNMKPAMRLARIRAEAKITVRSSEAKPYDQTANPPLAEINIHETFTGDIDGTSTVRALQVQHRDHSASLVSMQRFQGKLGGRQGTFVLQGSETVENGKIKATWFVVPGSGTGELSGLRGEGGFRGDFGKGSEGTLDYWFE